MLLIVDEDVDRATDSFARDTIGTGHCNIDSGMQCQLQVQTACHRHRDERMGGARVNQGTKSGLDEADLKLQCFGGVICP
jgi:hypothetical protein